MVRPIADRDRQVRDMFTAIAPSYDLLNTLLSLGLDRRWRRQAVQAVSEVGPRDVLDVATGTAGMALALKHALPHADVTGVDFSEAMLAVGRAKSAQAGLEVHLELGDGQNLSYPDDSFDAVTIAYGLRNFADRSRGLAEFFRVLRPGGRLAILEFPPPRTDLLGKLHRAYFVTVVPIVGGLVSGRPGAYHYLPASVTTFPPPAELTRLMVCAGLVRVGYRLQAGGISILHCGDKPA